MIKIRCDKCKTEFRTVIMIPKSVPESNMMGIVSWTQETRCPKCQTVIKVKPWYDVNDFFYGVDVEHGVLTSKLPKPSWVP
ncbi:MAG: hypothetical protein ACFFBS_01895 [Promethearchaeota archaeon]